MSKAFDRVNRNFLDKILGKLGFGAEFRKWIETLYFETQSQVIINGFVSDLFILSRGVRQGCPLSPLLFIISVEPLLENIRKNNEIKGFRLPSGKSCSKVKGYADDANYYLHDLASVVVLLEVIEEFGKASEAKLNRDKTKLLLVGKLSDKDAAFIGVKTLQGKLKVLGVWVGTANCDKENWDPIVEKIVNTLKLWRMRNLTIYGRACIIQTLALSKVWYVGSVLTPPTNIIDKIEKEITNFLWRGKHHLINREIVRLPKTQGGLGIVSIEDKCRVLKLKWLKEISDHRSDKEKDWVEMGNYFLMNFSPKIYDFSVLLLNSYHRRTTDELPTMYLEIIQTWQTIGFKKCKPKIHAFKKMYIWYNDTFVKTTEQDIDLMQLGIYRVEDLWDSEKNEVMNANCFYLKYCTKILRQEKVIRITIRYQTIKERILGLLNEVDFTPEENERHVLKLEDYFNFEKKDLVTKNLYWRLRAEKSWVEYRARKQIGLPYSDKFFQDFYQALNDSDIDNKTKSLSWLLSWKGVLVGMVTKDWFEQENGLCKICKTNEETPLHLFIYCNLVKQFWEWFRRNLDIDKEVNELTLYVNNYTEVESFHFYCIAIGKQAIWSVRNKCVFDNLTPSANILKATFKELLKSSLNVLLKVYFKKGNLVSFLDKYCNYGVRVTEMKIVLDWKL